MFEKYGVDNCHIVLLETFQCGSVDDLRARESYHIKSTPCTNKNIPGRTKQQYRDEHKEIYSEKRKARVVCVCGASLAHDCLTRHMQSAKHKSAIAAIEVLAVDSDRNQMSPCDKFCSTSERQSGLVCS